jgi:hypothetical protein
MKLPLAQTLLNGKVKRQQIPFKIEFFDIMPKVDLAGMKN